MRENLRRAVEAHIRCHARHRLEAFDGNRGIGAWKSSARSGAAPPRHLRARVPRTTYGDIAPCAVSAVTP
ncbi:hypothetical protein [Streptomyces sp. S465]|uniref:hypothetical protein n=1 Tax=Streptomyces sp. S465 TaxID=2979468 RepID=UPI0022A854AE|nr:hypothetical protein [Streptomyces sp. S465]WAP54104.1 hypothetical protein N6H00_03510 [Streptomyces sp. S465]